MMITYSCNGINKEVPIISLEKQIKDKIASCTADDAADDKAIADLKAKNKKLEGDIEIANSELAKKEDSIKSLEENKKIIEAKNADLTEENTTLGEQNAALAKEKETLEVENGNLVQEKTTLETQKNDLSAQKTELEAKNSTLVSENATLESEVFRVKKEYSTKPDMSLSSVISEPTQNLFVEGSFEKEVNVTGKNVVLDNVTLTAGEKQRRMILKGTGSVDMKATKLVGPFKRDIQKNATLIIQDADKVTVDGLVYEGVSSDKSQNGLRTYNLVEVALNGALPSEVTFKNCHFKGDLSNNGILVFGMKENGVINLENCIFDEVSNPFRYSNKGNVSGVTLNITDCECNVWEKNPEYAGFICLQDYTNTDPDSDPKIFGPEKLTINVKNSFGPGHKDLSTYDTPMNTLLYVYKGGGKNSGIAPFEKGSYPAINFIK